MRWRVKYRELSLVAKLFVGPFVLLAMAAGVASVVIGMITMVPIFAIAMLDGGAAIKRDFPKLKDVNGRE